METCRNRSRRPSVLHSRAKPITSRVPSTLIARASSSGRSNEIDAAQCSTAPTSSASAARSAGSMPRPGARDVARHRAHAVAVGLRIAPQLGEHGVEALGRGGLRAGPHERDDLPVAGLDEPREHLHAEEAGRAGEEDGRLHDAAASSSTGVSAVPMAWKPPSTCRISPVTPRARSREQEQDRAGDGRRVVGVPPERRLPPPRGGEVAEAGDPARGERPQRARGHEVHAHALRPEVARQVARRGLQRRLRDAHPVVDRPGDRGVEVEPDEARALLGVEVGERHRQRLERVRARAERHLGALGRRLEEVAAQRVLGRERDRVQHAVDAAPALAQLVGQRGRGRRGC